MVVVVGLFFEHKVDFTTLIKHQVRVLLGTDSYIKAYSNIRTHMRKQPPQQLL